MELISVIIPIYNVEKYIHRCVDSVINQTYKNLEIILVNDGSPDNCGNICDEYAKQDSRIKVIHKENGGLSDARNFGIEAAQGEWLFFIDSDDWLHLNTIRKLYEAAVEFDTLVSVCNYQETTGSSPVADNSVKSEVWTPKELFLNKHITATTSWGKLYRKECFKSVRYPVGKIHEDEFVTYKILFSQDKVAFIDQPYYAYFVNSEGITKSEWSAARLSIFDALKEQVAYFKEVGFFDIVEFIEQLYLKYLVHHYKMAKSCKSKKDFIYLNKKIVTMIIENPKMFFCEQNIWVLEYFYPRTIRCYWLFKVAFRKVFRRNTN